MNKREKQFVETVWEYYERHGRRSLPWRHTRNPYRILVSEVMLQQTRVERVSPKYEHFLKRFPNIRTLAEAPLGDVLREWQGLGYNRRAKLLHECAREIIHEHRGRFPRTYEALRKLPGLGSYTTGAVLAFAFNTPTPVIETNIRTVYLHHFFRESTAVTDVEIFKYITKTLDTENSREWYYALMDYGAHLKKTLGNQNARSAHHTVQKPFRGSNREVRGAIVRALASGRVTKAVLQKCTACTSEVLEAQLQKLESEGIITKDGAYYALPD